METCAAIANIGRGHKGYVLVGVAENAHTATRVQEIFGSKALSYNGFHITGVDHEANHAGKNLDQMFQDISDRVGRSGLSEPLKSYINTHLKCVRYFDKTVFVFEILGQDTPSHIAGKWVERQGAQSEISLLKEWLHCLSVSDRRGTLHHTKQSVHSARICGLIYSGHVTSS